MHFHPQAYAPAIFFFNCGKRRDTAHKFCAKLLGIHCFKSEQKRKGKKKRGKERSLAGHFVFRRPVSVFKKWVHGISWRHVLTQIAVMGAKKERERERERGRERGERERGESERAFLQGTSLAAIFVLKKWGKLCFSCTKMPLN